MNDNRGATTLEIDEVTASLLVDLAEIWRISKQEVVRRTVEQFCTRVVDLAELGGESEEAAMPLLDQQNKLQELKTAAASLTEREARLLQLHLEGYDNAQIAHELNEDLRVVRRNLLKLIAKLRFLQKTKRTAVKATTTESGRLEAFKELQSRLGLTPAKAAEWQETVREARR